MCKAPRSVRVSIRLYRLLLRLYPGRFRRQFGSEMTELFEDLAREALEKRSGVGLLLMWFRILLDTFRAASHERFHQAKHLLPDRSVVVVDHWPIALVLSLTAAMLVTPPDPASMFVLGIPLFGIYFCAAKASRLPRLLRVVFVSLGTLPLVWVIVAIAQLRNTAPFIGDRLNWITFVALLPLAITAFAIVAVSLADRIWACKCNSSFSSQ